MSVVARHGLLARLVSNSLYIRSDRVCDGHLPTRSAVVSDSDHESEINSDTTPSWSLSNYTDMYPRHPRINNMFLLSRSHAVLLECPLGSSEKEP